MSSTTGASAGSARATGTPSRSTAAGWGIWKYFLALAYDRPRSVTVILGLMILVSLTEGFGILLLIPLLGQVGVGVGEGSLDRISTALLAGIQSLGVKPTLESVLMVFVAVTSVRLLLVRSETMLQVQLEQGFAARVRTRLYNAIMDLPMGVFTRHRMSDLVHVLSSETDRYAGAAGQLMRLLATCLVGFVYVAVALMISTGLTLLAGTAGLLLVLALRRWNPAALQAGEGLSNAGAAVYHAIQEHLGGYKTIKSYGVEQQHCATFRAVSHRLAGMNVAVGRHRADHAALFGLGSAALLGLMVYGALRVFVLSPAGLLLLLFLFARIVPRFAALQASYHGLMMALPAVQRISGLIEAFEQKRETIEQTHPRMPLRDAIRFESVAFAYPAVEGRTRFGFEELNLAIPVRRTTAIVGPSGSGKSTIADLLIGLLPPDSGSILVDDGPLRAAAIVAWRRQVGYVAQDSFLFHSSIRANLLWAAPHACEADLQHALRTAAADFVFDLPQGMDTVIGDRGVLLSGGERQRIALARALIRNPDLLILDEATSALDTVNEARILDAIRRLQGRITIVIITHRLATIRDADMIHVMENGRLRESGKWADLHAMDDRLVQHCGAGTGSGSHSAAQSAHAAFATTA